MSPRRRSAVRRERRLARLNWMDLGERVPREAHTLLLPVGTLEPHGILSLGVDLEIPSRLSEALAERLNAYVAPAIPFGVTLHLGALPGATHVPAAPFRAYVAASIRAFALQGFRNIVVMNGHGGNIDPLRDAARRAHEEEGVYVAVFSWWQETRALAEEVLGVAGGHAGADETAAMIAIAPDQVFPSYWDPSLAMEHRDALIAYPMPASLVTYGSKRSDPVLDTRRAATYWNRVVEHVGDLLEDLVARWDREGYPAPTPRRRAPVSAGNGAHGAPGTARPVKRGRSK